MRRLYLYQDINKCIYVVIDFTHVSMICKNPTMWIVLLVERRVQNPPILFIYFLFYFFVVVESMDELELGPTGESSRQKFNALRTFPRHSVWLYHDTVFDAEVYVLLSRKYYLEAAMAYSDSLGFFPVWSVMYVYLLHLFSCFWPKVSVLVR
jgi:hypothetical protein